MAKIKGKWLLNRTLTWPGKSYITWSVNFTSNGKAFTKMTTSMDDSAYGDGSLLLAYYGQGDVYNFTKDTWPLGEAWRGVDFGEVEQDAPDDFTTWFFANAKERGAPTIFNLKSLNLDVGSHVITVVAKAAGYKNSEVSQAVSYVILPKLDAPSVNIRTIRPVLDAPVIRVCETLRTPDIYLRTEYPTMDTPTVEIDGDTLNIYDDSGVAEAFDILVNGNVVAEAKATKSLTLTNIGDDDIWYAVDEMKIDYDNTRVSPGETVVINNIESYVYCTVEWYIWTNQSTFSNCTCEYGNLGNGDDNSSCMIYPTAKNATASLYSYDDM